ncbi:endonuclease III related protein [Methanoculleus bourgensis MS2]|jgi:endonuclease-3 related protein|uniref:Endonuclease III related protein n=1 Tax=Methanoculleus bourgensis (strain ATCC 43281 / DSM 3045 / OCM 15 / MS2) TaxID=1201294 RepID=I7KCS9_METBM|nr:(Fe-S)-cluster assembly protein [Methanoculleus bourgensis]CCJ36236.1 endonuclease III related protein [Methanoculleus bourgensis MS2]
MRPKPLTGDLLAIYDALHAAFGHQHWWPAKTPFETMVGAILTQNVSWTNAAQAIANLEAAGMLDPDLLAAADTGDIARLIIPSRFYNQKAERIQEFAGIYVAEFQADPAVMAAVETGALRERLLAVRGFGKETVDTILLYACRKPVFVVDAYTRRIFSRYGLLPEKVSYDRTQRLFSDHLPPDVKLFNDYHAQIVRLGKTACRKSPLCDRCPIRRVCGSLRCAAADQMSRYDP